MSVATRPFSPSSSARTPPSDVRLLLLIARRGALESLRDRMTIIISLFFALAFPLFLLSTVLRPLASSRDQAAEAGLAIYFLIIGLMPTTSAVGIASGQFAGEKEQGNLTPLLASPASNVAIYGGKVLGSIIPGILFSIVAEGVYVGGLALTLGVATVRLLPAALSFTMLALVPIVALFAATIASLISSRVRTFNTAQQVSGLVLLPLWAVVFGVAAKLQSWGVRSLVAMIVVLLVIDVILTVFSATTWRREEVLAQR
jgi:ABC-type transport system involved in multi-copper enzyme maturation permease subunit